MGVMTKLFVMNRACYFASPPDYAGGPANWESRANVTPASAQFGFAGLSDPSVPYGELSVVWQTLGLTAFGAAVSVDSTAAPYGGATHMLTTNAQPATTTGPGQPLHGLTVRDAYTPKNADGQPVFDAAWGYLCFQ